MIDNKLTTVVTMDEFSDVLTDALSGMVKADLGDSYVSEFVRVCNFFKRVLLTHSNLEILAINSLVSLQKETREWSLKNFGNQDPMNCVLGVCEESGELAHAQLKMNQSIRGSEEQHIEEMKDAIGDIVIFLADLCNRNGFNFTQIINQTWRQVKQRDWKSNPETGK